MALKKLKKLYKTNKKSTSSSSSATNNLDRQASNLKTRLEASGVSTDSRNALQKALNLREGSGFLEGLGDVLERASGLASIKAALAGDVNKSTLQNMWEGFTGNQRYTGIDVIDTINPDFKYASGVERFLGGLATDILLDPATYLTAGATALAKNATTAGVKALGTTDDLVKVLKTTKTADQALDIVKDVDAAKDLLSASKLYRTADTIDTIANPLKLVPTGVKKLGGTAMKGIEKVSPEVASSLKKIGQEFTSKFNYTKWLKDHLGDDIYKDIKLTESISEASLDATSKMAGDQYKLIQKVLKDIKKDPDRVWTLTSKVDGSTTAFQFTGMTDDEIVKKLYEFANNQVYFKRPTVLNEDAIRSLAKNKGRLMLPVQDFANPNDRRSFVKALKALVDDPDKVSVTRYIQKETGKKTGWVINIGTENANSLINTLDTIGDDILKQEKVIAKSNKAVEVTQNRLKAMNDQLTDMKSKLADLEFAQTNAKTKSARAKAADDFTKLKQKITLKQNNISSMTDTTLARRTDAAQQAVEQLKALTKQKKQANNLIKPRQLKPYASPIINIPEMEEIASIQKQLTDTNLGIRNLGGLDVSRFDKYDQYIHKKLLPESQAYLRKQNIKNNPVQAYLIGATDKLPAQGAMTSIYGNFSPVEVNTMMGFDLFDNNIVASNLDMVTKLNRRSYNTQLTKALFSEPNDWVKNVRLLQDAEVDDLINKGYVSINSREIASKLKLNEILTDSDIKSITERLRGQKFLVSNDVIELFDKNKKLYTQLDSEFYQQLNKYMKYWKGGNLLSVGYHLRNWFGAQTNMALAGMGLDDIARYSTQAGLDVGRYNTKLLPEFRKWVSNPENADIFKMGTLDDVTNAFAKQVGEKDAKLFTELLDAQMHGVWGSIVGQHDAVKRAIGEMPKSKLGRVADKIQDINYKLGATSDDINRLASYRWAQNPKNYAKVTKVGAQDALDFVHYAMFDFKSMSPTEQAYFTKLFPFYNFIKNNLVFQFKNISKNAQSYNTLSKAYKNLYSAQELTDADVQQYVKDQLYIPIRQADGTIKVLKVAPPVQDATNLLSLKNILGASNPLIQYITDRAYGQDLYTGADLSGDRTRNTQELVDILPYGRSIRTTLQNPLGILLPVSSTTVEKGRNQNAYTELERLEKLRKQYKQQTGQSLPTLEELGLK